MGVSLKIYFPTCCFTTCFNGLSYNAVDGHTHMVTYLKKYSNHYIKVSVFAFMTTGPKKETCCAVAVHPTTLYMHLFIHYTLANARIVFQLLWYTPRV